MRPIIYTLFCLVTLSTFAAPLPSATNSQTPNEFFKTGYAAFQTGNYQVAINQLNLAIGTDPSRNFFYYHRGNAYKALGQKSLALADYQKSLSLKETPEANYQIALIKLENKDTAGAKLYFEATKSIREDYEKLNLHLGLIYFSSNEFEKAKESFIKYTDEVKTNSDAYLYLAMCEAKLNQNSAAIQDLNRSLMNNTTDWKIYLKFYEIYKVMGDNEKAIYNLSMVIELGQKKPEFFKIRAELYASIGDLSKAREDQIFAMDVSKAK